jgi:acetylornithine/N-succinyldiaminopimelate aminotransferase
LDLSDMTDAFMNTYHRLPVVFSHGEGAMLYDTQGQPYIDWTSGIAVNCLGHNHPQLVRALRQQAGRLCHVSNYYQSDVCERFAKSLTRVTGLEKVFLCNSGAEANECAIKLARKYSLLKYGEGRHTIVTLSGSFHGRTITTLAATGQEKFHTTFGPFTPGFIHTPPDDIAALEEALDSTSVCALMMEPIQGESGVRPLSKEFVRRARELCDERDILLIFDEVQTGVARTGVFLAESLYTDSAGKPVLGDIVTLAKGLGGGIPVGAALAGKKCADVLTVGDHGSTFGGNVLAAAAGMVVLDIIAMPEMLEGIREKGRRIQDGIAAWKHPLVREIRGEGLMLACDIDADAWPVLEKCVNGTSAGRLLILSAGQKTLRFLPPYIITDAEINRGLDILKEVLDKVLNNL